MSDNSSQGAVRKFLRDEFRREQESGFALLRQIPSTNIRKFLDYFSSLNRSERDALAEGLAQQALVEFFSSGPNAFQTGNAAFKKYLDATPLMWDWKYEDVQTLRMILAATKLEPDCRRARAMTNEIREWIGAIKPVKSTEIRKVVKLALSQLLVPLTVEHEYQYWNHYGNYQDNEICVTIDTASRYCQLEYEISVKDKKRGLILKRLNYERMIGLSFAHWDCLEQSNLDQSIALLKDFIVYCAEIPSRLPAEYTGRNV